MADSFDPAYFNELLKYSENNQNSIKQISSYMYYHRETYHEVATKLWKEKFDSSEDINIKFTLINILHEILVISAKKKRIEYISSFSEVLEQVMFKFSEECQSLELLLNVFEILAIWNLIMVYSRTFLLEVIKPISEKVLFFY